MDMAIKRSSGTVAIIGGSLLLLSGAIFGGQAIAANLNQPSESSVTVERPASTPEPTVTPTATPTPTVAPVAEPAPVVDPAPAPAPVAEEPAPAPDPAPVADLCPAGTQSNGSDGFNDTSCMPVECGSGPVPDPTRPQCDYFYPPSYYR